MSDDYHIRSIGSFVVLLLFDYHIVDETVQSGDLALDIIYVLAVTFVLSFVE
jgi:hypothetical protein